MDAAGKNKERAMTQVEKVLYTAKTSTTGGRENGVASRIAVTSSALGSTSACRVWLRDVAQALVDEAHEICPYSKATRGNIDVAINLV
jgi:organic hydroperoxide reductase OsmC/OhrA